MGLRYTYLHTSTLPRVHQIVWCRLPDSDGKPGPTVRPALVRGTKRHPPTNRGAALVSYGTVRLKINERGTTDLILQNFERLSQLGLPQAVRFDLSLSNWLPWCVEFFSPPEHSVYIVAGSLNRNEIVALRARLKRRGNVIAL